MIVNNCVFLIFNNFIVKLSTGNELLELWRILGCLISIEIERKSYWADREKLNYLKDQKMYNQ
jgi:hypothetical protein